MEKSEAGIPWNWETVKLIDAVKVEAFFTKNHRHVFHQHEDRLELLYIYSGSGSYQVGRRDYAVTEGDIVICNANTLHGENFLLPTEIQTYCCAYDGVRLPGLPENTLIPAEKHPVVSLRQYGGLIREMTVRIYQLYGNSMPDFFLAPVMAKNVLAMTWYEFLEQEKSSGRTHVLQKTETLIRRITEYLDQNYKREDLRMKSLCDRFHISASYLSHAFKRETGISPKQYVLLRRIGEAQSLLESTDRPIGEIETGLGFGSSVHFSSTFKKYVGMSPRDYRSYYRK